MFFLNVIIKIHEKTSKKFVKFPFKFFNDIKPTFKLNHQKASSEIIEFLWPSVISKLSYSFFTFLLYYEKEPNFSIYCFNNWMMIIFKYWIPFPFSVNPINIHTFFFYYFQHEINGYNKYIAYTHFVAYVRKCCRKNFFP